MRTQRKTEKRTYTFTPQTDSKGRPMLSFWISRGSKESK